MDTDVLKSSSGSAAFHMANFGGLLLCLLIPMNGALAQDWVLEGKAPWQARDSQAEWVFRDQLWIGGGWFQSFEAPPRDVWSSGDGRAWKKVNAEWLTAWDLVEE